MRSSFHQSNFCPLTHGRLYVECQEEAALHFAEKGRIALDRNVNYYLKSWKGPDNEFTEEQKVTLRRRLTASASSLRRRGGNVEMRRFCLWSDLQARWKEWETRFWCLSFPRFPAGVIQCVC